MAKAEVPLQFSKVRKQIPVIVTDEDEKPHEYSLREFTDEVRDEYLEDIQSRGLVATKDGEADLSKVKSLSGMQVGLVGKCFFDPEGELVPVEVLRTEYPATVITALFFKCMEINGLDKDAMDKAKNA